MTVRVFLIRARLTAAGLLSFLGDGARDVCADLRDGLTAGLQEIGRILGWYL